MELAERSASTEAFMAGVEAASRRRKAGAGNLRSVHHISINHISKAGTGVQKAVATHLQSINTLALAPVNIFVLCWFGECSIVNLNAVAGLHSRDRSDSSIGRQSPCTTAVH